MQNKPDAKRLPFLDNGIAQTAIVVEDLDRTVARYWEVFGVGPWQFYTYEKPLVKEMSYQGEPADYAMRIALSYFGPSRVELIEVKRGDSVYADHVRAHVRCTRIMCARMGTACNTWVCWWMTCRRRSRWQRKPDIQSFRMGRGLDWMEMGITPTWIQRPISGWCSS